MVRRPDHRHAAMSDALIVTSLPPRPSRLVKGADVGPAYFAQCIQSWRAAGFDVLSINPATELEAVAALGLPVKLAAATGPGLPLISEMLAVARASGSRLVGIVNADCHILPVMNLRELLQRRSAGRMLLCERVERDQASLLPLVETYGGFDGFFFNPQEIDLRLAAACDAGFRFGDVWWDFWFPCLAMASGVEVRRLMQPVLGHLNHAFRWSEQNYAENRGRMLEALPLLARQPSARPELAAFAEVMGRSAQSDLLAFAHIMRRWLRNSADCPELALHEAPHSLAEEYVSLLQAGARGVAAPVGLALAAAGDLALSGLPPAAAVRLSGWSFPESWGCWVDGHCGELATGLPATEATLRVTLRLRAHVSGVAPRQGVTVCVNDVPLACTVLADDEPCRLDVLVPRHVARARASLCFSLWASAPHSPRLAYGIADDRQLGVGLESLCMHPLGADADIHGSVVSPVDASGH